MSLVPLAHEPEGDGACLRAALSLSCATGLGFELKGPKGGMRAADLRLIRTAALLTRAKLHGAFEGSPDLRFEPGPLEAGEYKAELAATDPIPLVLETLLPPLSLASGTSFLELSGGTHLRDSPTFEYVSRHWSEVLSSIGYGFRFELARAGFGSSEAGSASARIEPRAPRGPLVLEKRGSLKSVSGVSGAGRLHANEAERQRDAAQKRLWEAQRIEAVWNVSEVASASPGSFLILEAVFEEGRAAFAFRGEKRVRPEMLGDRAARHLLRFLDSEGAVDPHLLDQVAAPLALSRGGGRISTPRLLPQVAAVARCLTSFGFPARTWGPVGRAGGLEVDRC